MTHEHLDCDREMLTTSDVGSLLGVSPRTVQTYVAAGRLPEPVRLGARFVRWPKASFLAWLRTAAL